MNRELFGVFGERPTFESHAPDRAFDRVLEGDGLTVGVRDADLPLPNRTDTYRGPEGICAIWGEVYVPTTDDEPARWLLERYAATGREALDALNGSYLVALEHEGRALVATDPIRSRECFHADAPGVRTFGTDSASVAATIEEPSPSSAGVLEFLHLGVVLGEGTMLDGLRRLPVDALLTPDGVEPLDRLVYDPREGRDHAADLAARLERAVDRRRDAPGRVGLLLSAGYDSRAVLATHPGIDTCYTLGTADSGEVRVAARLADQYGTGHVRLDPGEQYLRPTDPVYGQGIRETIHIHHDGYEDRMDVDTVFHGLLFDTLFRNYFVPRSTVDVGDVTVPLPRFDPDPDPVAYFLEKLECNTPDRDLVADADVPADGREEFLRERITNELWRCYARCDDVHNAFALFGLRNQPAAPFRVHLADQFREAFVAADAELLEWHLQTPPEHRTDDTFRRALSLLDDRALVHRPPDRPHDSHLANELEGFLRRTLPRVEPFDAAWPSRREFYDRRGLDRRLFPDDPGVHDHPVRFKLRLNDARAWDRLLTDERGRGDADVLRSLYGVSS